MAYIQNANEIVELSLHHTSGGIAARQGGMKYDPSLKKFNYHRARRHPIRAHKSDKKWCHEGTDWINFATAAMPL